MASPNVTLGNSCLTSLTSCPYVFEGEPPKQTSDDSRCTPISNPLYEKYCRDKDLRLRPKNPLEKNLPYIGLQYSFCHPKESWTRVLFKEEWPVFSGSELNSLEKIIGIRGFFAIDGSAEEMAGHICFDQSYEKAVSTMEQVLGNFKEKCLHNFNDNQCKNLIHFFSAKQPTFFSKLWEKPAVRAATYIVGFPAGGFAFFMGGDIYKATCTGLKWMYDQKVLTPRKIMGGFGLALLTGATIYLLISP